MYASILAPLSCCLFLPVALGEITGTYPIDLAPSGPPDNIDGTNLANYPKCAAVCGSDTAAVCPTQDPRCLCGPENRGNTSACEAVTCTDAEYQKAASLAPDLCAPFYKADPALSSSVSAAIAAATAAALDTVKKADLNDLSTFPKCAQNCIPPALKAGGCTSFNDLDCVCHCPIVDKVAGQCEIATCPNENVNDDFSKIVYIVQELCAPVGGFGTKSQSACRANGTVGPAASGTSTGNVTKPTGGQSPPIETFTAGAAVSEKPLLKAVLGLSTGLAVIVGLAWMF